MQPYFFPYIGYLQLMQLVDVFVFYDDAQYMKGGWVNRNRYLLNGTAAWMGYTVKKENYKLFINQREYQLSDVNSLKDKLKGAYAKAPYFKSVFPIICSILDFTDGNVASFNQNSLKVLADYLGIQCEFKISSELSKNNNLRGQDRVVDICKAVGATHYINTIGGTSLYSRASFEKKAMTLSFIQAGKFDYKQFNDSHEPYLSIIDVMMFNSLDDISKMMSNYSLLTPEV